MIPKGFNGLYYNVPEVLHDLRESYSSESAFDESDILEHAAQVDLLILDDLGAERTSGWVRDRLYLIINRRYERMKSLIVTTNISLNDLKEQVGVRIVSRLMEMCPIVLEFPSEDFREKLLSDEWKKLQKGR